MLAIAEEVYILPHVNNNMLWQQIFHRTQVLCSEHAPNHTPQLAAPKMLAQELIIS